MCGEDGDQVSLHLLSATGKVLVVTRCAYRDAACHAANIKFLVPVHGVVLHDVPEDRSIAHGHHGFGPVFDVFAQPRAQSATEDDDLQRLCCAGASGG